MDDQKKSHPLTGPELAGFSNPTHGASDPSQAHGHRGVADFVTADTESAESDHVNLDSGPAAPVLPTGPAPEPPEMVSAAKGVKEMIESILIAFILAFVFRAFVMEAFVIPTGSMATSLLGAHMRFTCEECGYTSNLGWQAPSDRSGGDREVPANATGQYSPICQNCKHAVPRDAAKDPPVRYGDRILVLKYVYIPWLNGGPRRWDVVVFKTPAPQPPEPLYTVNFIKRLVGLPGESVMILDGDIYLRPADKTKEARALQDEAYGWKIQPKPRYAQETMWRLVFDNDYRPLHNSRSEDGWSYPWIPGQGNGWDTGNKQLAREMTFDNAQGAGVLKFNFDADPRGRYLTEWISYNAHNGETGSEGVSDYRLHFFHERKSGDGPLRAKLTKHGQEWIAELTPGRAKLIHKSHDGPERVVMEQAVETTAVTEVDFANVDYQVTLRLNDTVVFQTSGDQYQPDVHDLLARYGPDRQKTRWERSRVEIEASKQKATLSHVSLWRDVFYTRPSRHGVPPRGIELGDKEYFVLGDNSAQSSDARGWDTRVDLPDEDLSVDSGRVPERFMLGRAFFVYWPAGYKPWQRSPASITPNFSEMRMIK